MLGTHEGDPRQIDGVVGIRQLREKRGVTQEDLAHEADITTGTPSLIERGHANPTWGTLKGITAALSISMGELAKLADRFET